MTERVVLTDWRNEHRARGLTVLYPHPVGFFAGAGHVAYLSFHFASGTYHRGMRCSKLCICERLSRIRESYGALTSTRLLGCRAWPVNLMRVSRAECAL